MKAKILSQRKVTQRLVDMGAPVDFMNRLCGQHRDFIHTVGESVQTQPDMLNEVACELADMALVGKHGIPIEEMCDDAGEFLDVYQDEFNDLYDDIERILTGQ